MSHTKLFTMLSKEARDAGSLQSYVDALVSKPAGQAEIAATAAEIAALKDKPDRKLRRDVLAMRLRRAVGGPFRVKRQSNGAGQKVWAVAKFERRAPNPAKALERACALVQANPTHPLVKAALAALGVPVTPQRGPAPRIRGARQVPRSHAIAPELRSH